MGSVKRDSSGNERHWSDPKPMIPWKPKAIKQKKSLPGQRGLFGDDTIEHLKAKEDDNESKD